jgi:hypothetical protein
MRGARTGEADSEDTAMTEDRLDAGFRSARRWGLTGLGVVIGIGVITILVTCLPQVPTDGTLRFEIAKTAIQLIAVAGIGSLAALATFTYQQGRLRESAEWERRAQRHQDDLDRARDARERQDELVRSIIDEALTAYNAVKRARRLLRAAVGNSGENIGTVGGDAYNTLMVEVIEQQLQFEHFARMAPLIRHAALSSPPESGKGGAPDSGGTAAVHQHLRNIEGYLNIIIREYTANRNNVMTKPVLLIDLPKLAGFVGDEFEAGIATQMDGILVTLQAALLSPVTLQVADEHRPLMHQAVASGARPDGRAS